MSLRINGRTDTISETGFHEIGDDMTDNEISLKPLSFHLFENCVPAQAKPAYSINENMKDILPHI
jgi:hypothetical protein